MANIWLYSLASVLIVSVVSLIGIITLSIKVEILRKLLIYLVSFAAGALLGDAFIHLLPEAVEEAGFGISISLYVLFGIGISFLIEKVVHWHHFHYPLEKGHVHPFAVMNLVGDLVHNFIDGLIIAASYMVNIPVGIATTIAVILHEIPQEISDFGVLLHGGFTKAKALFYNFLTALTAVLGAVVVLAIGSNAEGITAFLIPFTAGSFIYIAGSDLIPELHKDRFDWKSSLMQFAAIAFGVLVMYALLFVE
ncbi:ZIP family metal transporter [Candidatus Woesearchaeota archaeon]|nr:ZIP family metal transporter [Candidatus Woesearchaeota archaeon]